MSFLTNLHAEIESVPDPQVQKQYKAAFLTIMQYLEFVDDGNGFSEQYLKDRFNHRLEFKVILDKLISHSILKKSQEGNYFLNTESKKLSSPVFDNSLFLAKLKKEKANSESNRKFLYS